MPAGANLDAEVRTYKPSDRQELLMLAAETAFFGAPVEAYLEDRRIFLALFYQYYPDYEPQHIWVAHTGTQLIAFLTGCMDTHRQRHIWLTHILPRIPARAIQERWRTGPKSRKHTCRLLRMGLGAAVPKVDLQIYPAHLHINVAEGWRGRGLGQALITACLQQMHREAVPGVHLFTTSHNQAACILYHKLGFKLLDARPTQAWEDLLGKPIENRCYACLLPHQSPV